MNPKIKEPIVIEYENEDELARDKEEMLAESVPQEPAAEKTPQTKRKRERATRKISIDYKLRLLA